LILEQVLHLCIKQWQLKKLNELLLVSDVISLEEIEKVVQALLKDYDALSCYLFGSYAKGGATKSSDVDLLLLFSKEKYNYQFIHMLQDILESAFAEIKKYCRPIYGYIESIDNDTSILFRQYIGYGVLMYGGDIKQVMKKETQLELEALEYSHYWRPMYLKKMQLLEDLSKEKSLAYDSSLTWQYLFLALYWYAKAELTLINRQNSLNDFRLTYIYSELLKITLNEQEYECLHFIQANRESYKNG